LSGQVPNNVHTTTLDILRCPYCGGKLELVTSMFHRREGDEIHDGILGCQCCTFAVVDDIPVMHVAPAAVKARAQVEAGRPDLARRVMFNLQDDGQAARFDALASSAAATYHDVVKVIDPSPEGVYFLYRFSDPSYVVAHPLIRAVAGTVLAAEGRAIDICGGAGHLTRSLMDLSSQPPVLADLYFAKIWLARRFTAPGCEAVCCDGNAPMPFARGAFRFAMCADAFMFIWTKRQFIQEMQRLIDDPDVGAPGAIVVSHAHNERVWSPSHGNALPPGGYRDLFETLEPRLFAETGLFADVVRGGPLDLSRHDSAETLDGDPALVIVASRPPGREEVFRRHPLDDVPGAPGELRVNPLYVAQSQGDRVRLRLQFPSDDYAEEFGACRQYLPDEVVVGEAALTALREGHVLPELAELVRLRVILELPKRYY
jgi:uncharacterized protein YbaR (Trm112 family)